MKWGKREAGASGAAWAAPGRKTPQGPAGRSEDKKETSETLRLQRFYAGGRYRIRIDKNEVRLVPVGAKKSYIATLSGILKLSKSR